ncbi:MAG TPA: T9SS type A sorting domain-containing protein [Bacteroidales bacterium]|nr:T9SS type A sorting domain-containing protein [Bacteroidales bacterium]
MKTPTLFFGLLFLLPLYFHAQVQSVKNGPAPRFERSGGHPTPALIAGKPDHLMVPAKRNMFNPNNSIWRWDTIMCYNKASGDSPYQRVTRTYNSFGEQLSILYERRQGSLAWVNYARETDTYDSAGNWVYQLQELWQNNAWVNYQKQEFGYNANGDQVDWKRVMWDSLAWDNWWHYSWHFDANGLTDTCMYQEGQDSLWINHWLWIPSYDGNSNNTSTVTYTWQNNGWQLTNRDSTTYDGSGNPLTQLQQSLINSSWVNNSFHTHAWDTAGNCLSYLYQLWQNNAWENSIFNCYTYDPDGNKVMDIGLVWMNGAWVNSHRVLYIYDTGINLLSETSQDWVNSDWRNAYTEQYTYDSSGNSLTGKMMHWFNGWQPYDGGLEVYANHERDMNLEGENYRYEAILDSIAVNTGPTRRPGQVTLYPNPSHAKVHLSLPGISGDQNGSVTLYDLRGQVVLSQKFDTETTAIDVGGLKPGVYFVKVSNNRMTQVLKLVRN